HLQSGAPGRHIRKVSTHIQVVGKAWDADKGQWCGGKRLYRADSLRGKATVGDRNRPGAIGPSKDPAIRCTEIASREIARVVVGVRGGGGEVNRGAIPQMAGHLKLPGGFPDEGIDCENKGRRLHLNRGEGLGEIEAVRIERVAARLYL